MTSLSWLLAANIAVWIGLGGYLTCLALTQRRIEQRLRSMELLHHD